MEREQLAQMTEQALTDIITTFAGFAAAEVNQVPFAGSWTPGQLMQHVKMSAGGFHEIMHGPVANTERDPAASVETIKNIFLDFSIKMKSPAEIEPRMKDYDQQLLLQQLTTIRSGLLQSIGELDLSMTCTAMELPQMGYLTRLEAIHFVIYHTMRHAQQLKQMHAAFASGKRDRG